VIAATSRPAALAAKAATTIAGGLQQLPRKIYEDQLTEPVDLPTCHDLR
jgi:hypothetical protein